jgi:hypothetical protein
MSIIGLSMAVLPCCAEEDVEAGSAALLVDWPVYPRRAEHNTVAEGGNRRRADNARQNAFRSGSRYSSDDASASSGFRPLEANVWPENGGDRVGWVTPYPEGDKRPPWR